MKRSPRGISENDLRGGSQKTISAGDLRKRSPREILENDLRRDLKLARRTAAGGVGTDRRCDRSEVRYRHIGIGSSIFGSIQSVEHVGAKANAEALGDRNVLGQA